MNKCFSCSKIGHKVRGFPNFNCQHKGGQSQARGSSDAPKKNYFYSLRNRGEQETSLNMVTGMLTIFTMDV